MPQAAFRCAQWNALLIPPPRSGGEGRPTRSGGQGGGNFASAVQMKCPPPASLRSAPSPPLASLVGGGIRANVALLLSECSTAHALATNRRFFIFGGAAFRGAGAAIFGTM